MLIRLEIYNFVIIKHSIIEFTEGFNCISGETGAGKSLIFDAILFCTGKRITPSPLGHFDKHAYVELKLNINGEDLIIKREIFSNGPSQIHLNQQKSTLKKVQESISPYLQVVQQNQAFLDDTDALMCLDLIGNINLDQYQTEFKEYQALETKLRKFKQQFQSQSDIDLQLRELNELKTLNPSLSEVNQIEARLKQIDTQSDETDTLNTLLIHFQDRDFNHSLNQIYDTISRLNQNDLKEGFVHAYDLIQESKSAISNQVSDSTLNEDESLKLEARLQEYQAYIRRYISLDNLISTYDKLLNLESLNLDYHQQIESYESKLKTLKTQVTLDAKRIQLKRLQSIKHFTSKVKNYLADMYLKDVTFDLKHTEIPLNQSGCDHFEFVVNLNKVGELSVLQESASGGEKARFHLAILMVLSQHTNIPIYLFDEIDTGVSGRVAQALGQVFKDLGHLSQVITITHQAAVSAYATTHLHIHKQALDDMIYSDAQRLCLDGRIDEMAMMMSGQSNSASRTLATQLLKKGGN